MGDAGIGATGGTAIGAALFWALQPAVSNPAENLLSAGEGSKAEIVTGGTDVAASLQHWEKQERALTDHTQTRSAELARTRALGAGMRWDEVGLRAARHVPFGTRPEKFPRAR